MILRTRKSSDIRKDDSISGSLASGSSASADCSTVHVYCCAQCSHGQQAGKSVPAM